MLEYAEVLSDYHLLQAELKLRLKKPYTTEKLKKPTISQQNRMALQNRLQQLQTDYNCYRFHHFPMENLHSNSQGKHWTNILEKKGVKKKTMDTTANMETYQQQKSSKD